MVKSEIHFGTVLSSCIFDDGKKYLEIVKDDEFQKEVDVIELSRHQISRLELQEKKQQKPRATLEDNKGDVETENIYVGTLVAFMHYGVAFYGTVKYFLWIVNRLRIGMYCTTMEMKMM